MNWHYAQDGAPKGPVDEEAVRSEIARGVVRPDTLVWKEGMPDWRPASEFFDFSGAPPPPPPLAATPPALSTSAAPPASAGVPTNLVWAILATVLCCLPFGVVAVIYASKAGTANAAGDAEAAKAAAHAAAVWAWVSFIAYWAVVLLGAAAAAVLAPAVS